MTKWQSVTKGTNVELGGKVYTVTKAKPRGKRIVVTVKTRGSEFTSEVKASDKVTVVKLHDETGRQQRWATEKEVEPPRKKAKPVKPAVMSTDSWTEPRDKTERRLEKTLGARLVAESVDDEKTYYVPPVDVTTVAAHWMIFHEGDWWEREGEAALLARHTAFHAQPSDEQDHLIAHTHTETRPA